MTRSNEPTVSAIVICKDEANTIRACLDSVCWANEIVVVDSGSTDGTVAICREYTDRVYQLDWPGYGPQKNRALAHATGDWVLSIDADETVPPELFGEIHEAIRRPDAPDAFRVPRLSSYCGNWIHHGGWSPDYVTRLFRRDRARFSDDLVHERVLVEGGVGTLSVPLRHETFRTLADVLGKIDEYSTAGAEMAFRRGRRATLLTAVVHGAWAFLRTYLLRAGFLDGAAGFMLAVSNAEGTYYRYLKLRELALRAAEIEESNEDSTQPAVLEEDVSDEYVDFLEAVDVTPESKEAA